MKEIKIQEKDNFCLCSILQTIFKEHQIQISQTEISGQLTKSRCGFLVDDSAIKNFLISQGFNYNFYWYNEIPFNESDLLLKEMNNYHGVIGIKTHTYLLNEFKDPLLTIIDPQNSSLINSDIFLIRGEMEKKGGFFGLLKYIL